MNQIKRESDFVKEKSAQKQTNQKNNTDKKEKVYRQCKAILKNGKRCSRKAQEGSDYCWQHQNKNKD
ncbi:DUF5763 domain-containing protein [Melioribacteraceae bacterium 4301-Me]|uniref:DUF5763 domain-containing protein n=1 Tax=Pyranulibacter aquaticus TaxID=3163344 RepID=UPI00359A520B